ncbi:MAG: aminotransferase class V-fold PLP-dependent enzyme, partial [Deltaproteobacteria bacterium]|nr:aminotransferase class V-fold PLP-dependent enzyme [Deltaproteobacteria bacterium]
MSIKSRLYFDHNATTYVSASVLQALKNVEEIYGNPSSVHWAGREARHLLNESRERMAAALNCHETELVFTSGATESTNHALVGLWESRHDLHQNEIISSPVEHHATLRTLSYLQSRGAQIQWIEIDSQGRLSRKDLKNKISSRTFCVSLMAVQNEIGNLYPIDSIAEICQSYGVIFHCDAVQAIGKINFQSQKNGPDLFSISAHKFHGPKGVGALYLRQGIKLAPFHHGGRQERSLRAGTENLLGIY